MVLACKILIQYFVCYGIVTFTASTGISISHTCTLMSANGITHYVYVLRGPPKFAAIISQCYHMSISQFCLFVNSLFIYHMYYCLCCLYAACSSFNIIPKLMIFIRQNANNKTRLRNFFKFLFNCMKINRSKNLFNSP